MRVIDRKLEEYKNSSSRNIQTLHVSLTEDYVDNDENADEVINSLKKLDDKMVAIQTLSKEEIDFVNCQATVNMIVRSGDEAREMCNNTLSSLNDSTIRTSIVLDNLIKHLSEKNTRTPLKTPKEVYEYVRSIDIIFRSNFKRNIMDNDNSIEDLKLQNIYFGIFDLIPDMYVEECYEFYLKKNKQ